MYQTRTLILRALLGGLIFSPAFVFAQTSTTTAEQPTVNIQQEINNLLQDQLNAGPTAEAVRAKAIKDYLSIKTTPSNPGPRERVSVSIESYLTDLNKATIEWTLNNKTVSGGVGEKSFSFMNGQSSQTTNLTVSITTNTGESITKDFSWTPVGVTVFWEADTYTPPFYRGKPLLSAQAKVKVVATPDSTGSQNALGAGNLVYVWEKGGTVVSEASGYGKNSLSLTGPKPFDLVNIKVKMSSVDNTVNSEAKINLPLSNPFVLFYENSPLLGVTYNRPFGQRTSLSRKEFSLSAEPYFFSKDRGDTPALNYSWLVNGKEVSNEGRIITLRNETGVKGSSDVSIAIRGLRQTFQTASQSLRVDFTESASTGRPLF